MGLETFFLAFLSGLEDFNAVTVSNLGLVLEVLDVFEAVDSLETVEAAALDAGDSATSIGGR